MDDTRIRTLTLGFVAAYAASFVEELESSLTSLRKLVGRFNDSMRKVSDDREWRYWAHVLPFTCPVCSRIRCATVIAAVRVLRVPIATRLRQATQYHPINFSSQAWT